MNEKQFLNNGEYICAYCLNKNEDRVCDDYYQCCNEMNKLENSYSNYLEKQIKQLQQENEQLKEQLKQRDEVIDEISKILNRHRFEENDDYYDYSEQGICITGWDDDYDRLNELLQKYKGDNK